MVLGGAICKLLLMGVLNRFTVMGGLGGEPVFSTSVA
jgi:hypothetical protein